MEEIKPEALEIYCKETAHRFVKLYPWYYMPHGLHKLLVHFHQVVRNKNLPIGMLSEEAHESRNKDAKNFREFFTLKVSRKKENLNLMRRLLCRSSDQLTPKQEEKRISSSRKS